MLKVNEVKLQLQSGLSEYFSIVGFTYRKANNEFIRDRGDFRDRIHLTLTSFNGSISLRIFIYLKYKPLEKILMDLLGIKREITIGNEAEIILNRRNNIDEDCIKLSVFLMDDQDVTTAIDMLKRYSRLLIFPYFEKYSEIENLEKLFNNEPFEEHPVDIGGNTDYRCFRGLILADMVGNKNKAVVDFYDKLILRCPEESILEYKKLKKYLNLE